MCLCVSVCVVEWRVSCSAAIDACQERVALVSFSSRV